MPSGTFVIHGKMSNVNIHSSLEEVDSPSKMNDFEGLWIQWEEAVADVGETTREPELEVDPDNMTELLPCQDKLEWMRSPFLWMSTESGFPK